MFEVTGYLKFELNSKCLV